MDEVDKYKRAAELLLKGAKMLNIACPVCNDPIYEMKDSGLFCSTCQKNIIRENSPQSKVENKTKTNVNPIIQNKINELLSILEDEKDLDKISQIAKILEKLSKLNVNS